MGSSKKNLKKRLYKSGTEALSAATGQPAAQYFCPICGNAFTEGDLENGTLTLEHIPPEAQGGKGIALTCVKCNSTAGHSIDIAATNRNHLEDMSALFSGEGKFSTHVRMELGTKGLSSVNYEFCVDNGVVRFYPVPSCNQPDHEELMIDYIKRLNQTPDKDRHPWAMKTRKHFNPSHAKIGDLRSAFLVAFAKFGYNFAFDPELVPVRMQIINYNAPTLDYFFLSPDPGIEPTFTLGIVTNPFSAIFCQLKNYGILLPWTGSPKNFYNHLKEKDEKKGSGKLNFTFTPIDWPKQFEALLDIHNDN